jgi:hypothetical protein
MNETPRWLAPVVLGGAGVLGGLVLNYVPAARTGIADFLKGHVVNQALDAVVKSAVGAVVTAIIPSTDSIATAA